jgi:hypothetical protein
METISKTENLLLAAKKGRKRAESEILVKLSARFLPIVSLTIKTYQVLAVENNIDMRCEEVCQKAIANVLRLYPISSDKFSLKRAVIVLHNVLDDYIANALYQLAKSGSTSAEESLFSLIRKKLDIYLKNKFWRS